MPHQKQMSVLILKKYRFSTAYFKKIKNVKETRSIFLSIIKYRYRLLKYVRKFIYFSKSKKVCLMGEKTFKTVGCM